MGRVLRLIVALVVLFGIWKAASAEMDQMKFEEAVKHVATFSGEQDEFTVREAVMKEAKVRALPVEPSLVFVKKDSDRIHIEVTYIRTVRLLTFYSIEWPFAVKVDSSYILGGRIR
jgi:hypothetical protein